MHTAQGIEKGDVLQRLAGASFIVGALMLIVFFFLHPDADLPGHGVTSKKRTRRFGSLRQRLQSGTACGLRGDRCRPDGSAARHRRRRDQIGRGTLWRT